MVLKYYQVVFEVSFQGSPDLMNSLTHLGCKHTSGQRRGSYTSMKMIVD